MQNNHGGQVNISLSAKIRGAVNRLLRDCAVAVSGAGNSCIAAFSACTTRGIMSELSSQGGGSWHGIPAVPGINNVASIEYQAHGEGQQEELANTQNHEVATAAPANNLASSSPKPC